MPELTADQDTEKFVALCVPLTGFTAFDLYATGMAGLYLATARKQVGADRFGAFLSAWREAHDKGTPPEQLPPVHREVARAVTYLWYTGSWPRIAPEAHALLRRETANTEVMASADSYPEGLVWRAFNGHANGSKPPGFGTWSMKPPVVATEAQIRAALKAANAPGSPDPAPAPPTPAGPGGVEPHLLPGFRPSPSVPPSEVPRAAAPPEHKQVSDR